MTKKDNRGGARPGAGRKPPPIPRVRISLRLSADLVEFAKAFAPATATEIIEDTMRSSEAFIDWQRKRKRKRKSVE
jgi:hypothetical protein